MLYVPLALSATERARASFSSPMTRDCSVLVCFFSYDVCTVHPNLKYWKIPCEGEHEDYPPVCSELKLWIDSPVSANWVAQTNVKFSFTIERAIEDAMKAIQCYDQKTWTQCFAKEVLQKRV
jgi:hypothetical protein